MKNCIVILVLIALAVSCESNNENSITILVVGRRGAGVSSTIRELIGPSIWIPTSSISSFNQITEYTVKLNMSSSSEEQETPIEIKFIDVPSLVDGRTLEEDAYTLASLKSYLLANRFPDYLLGVSRFDDNEFTSDQSPFVRFLKTIEIVRKYRMSALANPVFLFTNLMSEKRDVQRYPIHKMNEFNHVIMHRTSISSPLTLVVGDNLAGSEYEVDVQDYYYKLPNKELYPKNVWNGFINVTSSESETKRHALTFIMNNRGLAKTCNVEIFMGYAGYGDEMNNDLLDTMYLLQQPNILVQENEVNAKIQEEFEKGSEEEKSQQIVHILALQVRLQNMNITRIEDLPKNVVDRAAFFQQDRFTSSFYLTMFSSAFGLTPPEYRNPITVGYGYDLVNDELVPETPFRVDSLRVSEVGYEMPNFVNCNKYFGSDKEFLVYSNNYSEYTHERFKYFDFEGDEQNVEKFSGKIKEGFNIKPNRSDNTVTVSGVQEIRVVKCLLDSGNFNVSDEFAEAVNSMKEFSSSDRDTVNEWVIFFNRFGSHVVTKAYGGGSLRGFLSLSGRNVLLAKSKTRVYELLHALVEFNNFSGSLGSPFYRFNGGVPNYRMEQLHDLPVDTRESLFKTWIATLDKQPVMLTYELGLTPISEVARIVDEEKGELVAQAIELLLRGDLKYSRRRSTHSGRKTARKYLPAKYKNIINQMNQTFERERVELDMQTQLIRQHNDLAENEFKQIQEQQRRRNQEASQACGSSPLCRIILGLQARDR
ncbi:unnamed protein product [Orchesella dallaii]|uniref:MACPF domain-containing protein n=1 Tax=Orchesella dallaii TaxID=48710 RepID=A0ABP1REP3_9HEXA